MKKQMTNSITLCLIFLLWFCLAFECKSSGGTDDKPTSLRSSERNSDAPGASDIKEMIERKMTSNYEYHFGGTEKSAVEFEWLAPIQIGGLETRGRIPVDCWAVKLDVKVTFTHPSSGETSWARRGINGNPVKEMFCVYKDAYDEWDFLTYLP